MNENVMYEGLPPQIRNVLERENLTSKPRV